MSLPPQLFRVATSSGVPIFRQIMDQVRALIACGDLAAGEMLPSTRELARELEVNMMTVSKAYSRLEADGVVERVRGLGMRVVEIRDTRSATERKRDFQELVAPALHRARQLGLSDDQILSVVKKALKDSSHEQ
ncbi:GntR family transcriptional regulator [Allorhodopirellula solitaria]|uniref:HTH-type transcriptional repressor YtrA n=1 Tax=Allorhodopirellula solitaria TaxID=2527987 RepID=A0A5C5YFK8_9BACT|nr:GntR family transcriptional regulator [Allorhodopirellula solitaria]TWT73261.1 HTH-type transcriptional repressor YtrA [Allorhodopirellula solitaria]